MKKFLEFRNHYIDSIRRELLGPGSGVCIPDEDHEIISSRPDVRYSLGILFPQKNKIGLDNNDLDEKLNEENLNDFDKIIEVNEEIDDKESKSKARVDDDNLDEEVSLSSQNLPSSMGISFIIKGNIDEITCNVRFATYEKVKTNDCKVPNYNDDIISVPDKFTRFIYFDKEGNCLKLNSKLSRKEVRNILEKDVTEDKGFISAAYRLAEQSSRGYKRVPHFGKVILRFGNDEYIDNNKKVDNTYLKITALKREIQPNIFSITIMAVNERYEKSNGLNCIFQSILEINTTDNDFSFLDINSTRKFNDNHDKNKEDLEFELLYRKKKSYATGLGVSCNWDINDNGKGKLNSEYLPEIELPAMDFEIESEKQEFLSMKFLSDLNSISFDKKISMLTELSLSYKNWINKRKKEIERFSNDELYLKEIALNNMSKCEDVLQRITQGIEILSSNENARASFLLANRAMFMQREQIEIQRQLSNKDRYPGDQEVSKMLVEEDYLKADSDYKHKWRPFQIAFLLMSINSIVNEESIDRNIVDLIWFPTGGGKTEAYLGLTAFSIFYRRFINKDSYKGTAVIMRYTLRLLTAQQFTRASTLICACEFIRQDSNRRKPKYKKYNLGSDEITIGLWIGGNHTPNRNKEAFENIKKLIDSGKNDLNYNKEYYNKFQVIKCPWCGTKLEKDVKNGKLIGQFGYKMKNNSHFFLHCTNNDCYFNKVLPIQVVDEELYKKPPTLLFGTVDKFAMLPWKEEVGSFFASKSNNRQPELIIQDELHLISGPLGTIVGLFETAIDGICDYKGLKPKIIASTATIRRAKEQCSKLYNREVKQFPPSGINSEDSFFAKESKIEHSKGNFGRKYLGIMPSGKTKAMMEIRAISSFLQKVYDSDMDDSIKDKYWTLTIYFNSLKELGKCRTLIDDDVKDALKRMSMRRGKKWRPIGNTDELTSRVTTVELNKTLDKLEKVSYSQENIKNRRFASNTLIATNMISVGIDVDRLNTMILVGQPKLTSEYIQASSRVGRKYPGLASVIYDGTKSRDRSHYEQFIPYHQSYYRYVEPTGVTPFSMPAIERALHSVIVGMLRNISDLSSEKSAANFNIDQYSKEIKYVKDYILNRYKSIMDRVGLKDTNHSEKIIKEFDQFLQKWEIQSENFDEDNFVYGYKYMVKHPKKENGRLLKSFNSDRNDLAARDTLTSMRNVDSSIRGNVIIWED